MNRSEIIAIIERHSEWLKSGGKNGTRGYLINMDLIQSDFSRLNLSEMCFDGSNLDGCNFQWSIMERTKVRNAKLHSVDFRYAMLTAADFHLSELSFCDLRSADLSEASFSNATLKGTDLCEANMQNIIWSYAVLDNIKVSRASLNLIPKNMLEVFDKNITVL
jgi:uncharacterized protein YjbI with pentapeptide repeats